MIPKSGNRFSEKIMLEQTGRADDDSKRSHRALPPCAVLRETAHEGFAGGEVFERDVLVRLMRLVDRARAADDGGDAGALEAPGLGREGHGGGRVAARKSQRQLLGLGARRWGKAGNEHLELGLDAPERAVAVEPG